MSQPAKGDVEVYQGAPLVKKRANIGAGQVLGRTGSGDPGGIDPPASPPNGAAGGDLSGTYPNPAVAKVAGVTPGAGGLSIIDDASAAAMRTTLELGTAAILASDTDTALAANSDARIATQKAVKAYIDSAVTGLLEFKGSTDCAANPNYPSANKGDAYYVTVAGKIGGASGKSVDVGDVYVTSADNAGGTEAAVGSSWFVLEHNLLGAIIEGDSRLSDARTPTAHATSHKNGGSDEVATATPGAAAIPKADGSGKLDSWVTADAAAATASLRKLGTAATYACAGNDSRLSDSRTPTAHAASHGAAGSDPFSEVPRIVQSLFGGNASFSCVFGAAPTNGNTVVLVLNYGTNSTGSTSVSSTNTTWTKVKSVTNGTTVAEVWIGVVAASAGATISFPSTASFCSWMAYEVALTLTGTAGASNSGTGTSPAYMSLTGTTAGRLVVVCATHANTTNVITLFPYNLNVGRKIGIVPATLTFVPTGGTPIECTWTGASGAFWFMVEAY